MESLLPGPVLEREGRGKFCKEPNESLHHAHVHKQWGKRINPKGEKGTSAKEGKINAEKEK